MGSGQDNCPDCGDKCKVCNCGDDAVNSPGHYIDGGIETIDFIRAKVQCFESYCLGNCLKYISRAGKKNNKKQDLEKARWYLDKVICLL